MRYIVAVAVYLLVGCAPLSAPQKQSIRPASQVRPAQPKIAKDSDRRDKGTSGNRLKNGLRGGNNNEPKAPVGHALDLSSFPQAQALIEQLITRAEQHVPSFAHQLKWAFDQDLETPTNWRLKSDQSKAESALAVALERLNQLDRKGRQFCESYQNDAKTCATWPAKTDSTGTQNLQNSLSVAGILLAKNSETLKAESLKKILSSIPFEAPYLVEEKLSSTEIIKGAQRLDSQKKKLREATGRFAEDLKTHPLCVFKETSNALSLSLEDPSGTNNAQVIDLPFTEIDTQKSISFVRDEQQILEFAWAIPDGQAVVQTLNLDVTASGLRLELKDGSLSCY